MEKQKFFSGRRERKITEVLFLVPTVLAFIVVIIIPFFIGIYYSFTDWDGVNAAKNMVGITNYTTIFNVIAVNVVAFLMALLVTSQVKGRNLYRAGFFVPNLIGGIVLGSIWQFIFASILPAVGKSLGIEALSASFITNANTVVGAMVTVNTWQYAGYIMMIYVASIQGISQQVMEAASVDGATYWVRVRKILIPLMANAFTISLFLTLTTSFKMYDVNLALTNGGPVAMFMKTPVQASELLALNIYNTAFKYSKMAQGQAKAVVFFVILVVVSLVQVSINKSKEVEM